MEPISTRLDFLSRLPLYAHEKPYILIPPADNEQGWEADDPRLQNIQFTSQPVEVHDARLLASCSLSVNGFESFHHDYAKFQMTEESILEYRAETERILKEVLKADDVLCYDFRASIFGKPSFGTDMNDLGTQECATRCDED